MSDSTVTDSVSTELSAMPSDTTSLESQNTQTTVVDKPSLLLFVSSG